MRGEAITILQGKMVFPKYKMNETKECLVSIYWEFEEEIQSLFNWRI